MIDWIPEATLFQKFKGYVIDSLLNNYLIKTLIATIVGIVVSWVVSIKRQTK